jgi:hypothetical protein
MEQIMDDLALWELMRDAWLRLEQRYSPAVKPLVSKSKLTLRDWMLLLAALTFEPEDTTPSHLMVRGPYTSSEKYLAGLEKASKFGYLNKVSDGRYRLSDSGKESVQRFIYLAREAMNPDPMISSDDLEDLALILKKLVDECLASPPPPDKWSIGLSKKLLPPVEQAMPFIEQSISCLAAFRDDAHLASWCSSGLSASAMESLTLIWQGQIDQFNNLVRKLEFRGHPESVYLDALAELRNKGYIEGSRNHIRITARGDNFRNQVEDTTNEYFFHPWSCLTENDKFQIANLLPNI